MKSNRQKLYLIAFSLTLILVSCGKPERAKKLEKNEKEIKTIKVVEEPKKEKTIKALPTKKSKHENKATKKQMPSSANLSRVSNLTLGQNSMIKYAEITPTEMKNKIESLISEGEISELIEIFDFLTSLKRYNLAFLVASNFLEYANTETEKQIANTCHAILSSRAFVYNNDLIHNFNDNKAEYENLKKNLTEGLENAPEIIDNKQLSLTLAKSMDSLIFLLQYDQDVDSMFKIYDSYIHKIKDTKNEEVTEKFILNSALIILQTENRYKKVKKISVKNLNKTLKYLDEKIAANERVAGWSINKLKKIRDNTQKYINYKNKSNE